MFQQDSAPNHKARNTVQLLQQETPEFIASNLWPSNSPDLNQVDYHVWGLMQERVYKTVQLTSSSASLRLGPAFQTVIDKAIDERGYEYEPVSTKRDITTSTRLNEPAVFRAT